MTWKKFKYNNKIILLQVEVMIIQIYSLIEKNEQFTLFGHDSPIYYLLLLNIGKLISLEVSIKI